MKHTIILPDLGQTTSEAKIVKWLKAVGERLSIGEALLEVETDKATMDVEAYVGGYLRKILAREGVMAPAMSPIAILTDTADETFDEEAGAHNLTPGNVGRDGAPTADLPHASSASRSAEPFAEKSKEGPPRPVAAAPAARQRAKELSVDLSQVTGTGPNGLITKSDVERFAKQREPAPGSGQAADVKLLAAMASFASASKSTVPHFYATADLDVSGMEEWRRGRNALHPAFRISVNDCLVRASAQALADSPRVNVGFADGRYVQRATSDVLLVVGRDPGLILVPLPAPHAIALPELARRIRVTVEAARQGRMPSAFGTDSPLLAISNLGMFGVREFAAIIPPGCTAILAIGAVRDQAALKNGQLINVKTCGVTLSADHRVVDGITAARFLERLQFHVKTYESLAADA